LLEKDKGKGTTEVVPLFLGEVDTDQCGARGKDYPYISIVAYFCKKVNSVYANFAKITRVFDKK